MTTNGLDAEVERTDRARSWLRYAGPTAWIALVAVLVGSSALAYATMPDPMTIHWRIGLDGAVAERTVPRSIGSVLFVPFAVLTLAVALAFRQIRDRSSEIALAYDLVVTAVLVALAAMQALLLVLNALLA